MCICFLFLLNTFFDIKFIITIIHEYNGTNKNIKKNIF